MIPGNIEMGELLAVIMGVMHSFFVIRCWIFILLQYFCTRLYGRLQSHYKEVTRWEIFMEQALRFGWIWAGLATFEAGFLMFSWAKFFFVHENMKKSQTGPNPAQISIPVP